MTAGGQLLVVDGHPVLREGLLALVEREPDITVCGVVVDGEAAVAAVREHAPRVVLIDVSVSERDGVETTRLILDADPEVRVLCFSLQADRRMLARLLEAGASGYLLWSAEPSEVLMAIRAVAAGQTYLTPVVTAALVRDFVTRRVGNGRDETHLTPREYEVLQLIAEGYGTGQVAVRLSISPKTVNTHREHIMAKLDLHTNVALCRYAIQNGVVTGDLDLT